MNAHLVAIQARIAAVQARIAGMQATNQHWAAQGQSPAYDEGHFINAAHALENLASAAEQEAA